MYKYKSALEIKSFYPEGDFGQIKAHPQFSHALIIYIALHYSNVKCGLIMTVVFTDIN